MLADEAAPAYIWQLIGTQSITGTKHADHAAWATYDKGFQRDPF